MLVLVVLAISFYVDSESENRIFSFLKILGFRFFEFLKTFKKKSLSVEVSDNGVLRYSISLEI